MSPRLASNSLCSQGWPCTPDPPASVSRVLWLQAHTAVPSTGGHSLSTYWNYQSQQTSCVWSSRWGSFRFQRAMDILHRRLQCAHTALVLKYIVWINETGPLQANKVTWGCKSNTHWSVQFQFKQTPSPSLTLKLKQTNLSGCHFSMNVITTLSPLVSALNCVSALCSSLLPLLTDQPCQLQYWILLKSYFLFTPTSLSNFQHL